MSSGGFGSGKLPTSKRSILPGRRPKPHHLPPLSGEESPDGFAESSSRKSGLFDFNVSDVFDYDLPDMKAPSAIKQLSLNPRLRDANNPQRRENVSQSFDGSLISPSLRQTPSSPIPQSLNASFNGASSSSPPLAAEIPPRLPFLRDVLLPERAGEPLSPTLLKRSGAVDPIVSANVLEEETILRTLKTGDDAIVFFSKAGKNSPVKFVYLNRAKTGLKFRPYDLVVVARGETEPEHFTMSASGVVHVQPGHPSEFMSLSEWMRESSLFNVLTRIKFYKYYLIGKAFTTWRKNVRYKLYCQTRNRLSKRFFVAKSTFCPTLLEVHRLCFDLNTVRLMYLIGGEGAKHAYTPEEFSDVQVQQRTTAVRNFEQIIEKMEEVLVKLCDSVTSRARMPDLTDPSKVEAFLAGMSSEDGGKTGSGKRSKSMVEVQQEQQEKLKALKKAAAEKEMLSNFIRLADYMAAEALMGLTITTMSELLTVLQAQRKSVMFSLTIGFQGEKDMTYKPEMTDLVNAYRSIIDESVSTVQQVPRVLYMRQFKAHFSEAPSTWTIGTYIRAATDFQGLKNDTENLLSNDFKEATEYARTFEEYRQWHLFGEAWHRNPTEFSDAHHTVQDFNSMLDKIKRSIVELERMKVGKEVGVLFVDSKKLKNTLVPVMSGILDSVKSSLVLSAREVCVNLLKEFTGRNSTMQERPSKLKEFASFVDDTNRIRDESRQLMNTAEEVERMYELLTSNDVKVSTEDQVKLDDLHSVREQFMSYIESSDEFRESSLPAMTVSLDQNIAHLNEELLSIMASLRSGDYVNPGADPKDVLNQLASVKESIDAIGEKAGTFTSYQKLFRIPRTEWNNLNDSKSQYEAKLGIWDMLNRWNEKTHSWRTSPFNTVDVEELNKEVQVFFKDAYKLVRANKDAVCEHLKESVDEWKVYLPVVLDLGNRALRPRHWRKIFGAFQRPYSPDAQFTLDQLFAYKCMDHKDIIAEVSATASGEFALESMLDKIKKSWEECLFTTKNHRDAKDVYIIGGIDEITQLLEDNQVLLQTMMASRFIAGIREDVEKWDKKLALLSETLDEWLTCQKNWMYLEFIFSSEDIQRQLPEESAKFKSVDKDWKDLMRKCHANPNVLLNTTASGVLDMLVNANKLLEEVQKSLEDYLETKRVAFPRFYFLSNDELLEILSQTRDPRAVQAHLSKCFDSIKSLDFKEQAAAGGVNEIRAMISPEGERVEFSNPVYTKGNVENWLQDIEDMMVVTLGDVMRESLKAYSPEKRESWFFQYASQAILCCNQISWTREVTAALEAIESGANGKALTEYAQFYVRQLDKMVELVRGQLSSLQRKTMGSLIVIDVHARDVVDKMIREKCRSPQDFEWTMQLRYYWDADVDDVMVRQTNASFRYGYEYLGNQPRLVITPLTDRCYMTCTGALNLNLGAAPQGPAGTGKTESVKDLAKALARQCVVFNCSDGLDFRMMGRMFSGLAQTGAWSCFDEFNRIDIEVLSVIAQQMLTIRQAVVSKVSSFVFEGREIKLNPTCGVFITMNPGYAGRTELPDNLKALFRPVSMMIPDYALIAEIMLFSEGFSTAKVLAQKMVQLFKLSSEQLSKQDHYDFGMRAVKSILVMAGALKRGDPDLPEHIVLIRAMRDANVPKFLAEDVILFMAIISDLFPGVEVPNVDYGQLQSAILDDLHRNNMQAVPTYVTKIIQLFETMIVRHGVMLVGQTGSGKSVCLHTLKRSLIWLKNNGFTHFSGLFQSIITFLINPKSVTMGELYGEFNEVSHEWTDGLIASMARQAVNDTTLDRKWIVFDGPVDALWIENMNTVLDDNKMLCLVNGERIKLPNTVTMVFEVQDLSVASPATVSRCGMVYLEPNHLEGGWKPLIRSWVAARIKAGAPKEHILHVQQLINTLVEPALDFLRREVREFVPSVNANLVTSLLSLVDAFLFKDAALAAAAAANAVELAGADDDEEEAEKKPEAAPATPAAPVAPVAEESSSEAPKFKEEVKLVLTRKIVDMFFTLAVVWSIGGNVDDATRLKFDQYARPALVQCIGRDAEMPAEGTIYDYCIDTGAETGAEPSWQTWLSRVPEFKYDSNTPYFNMLVPTVDTTRMRFILGSLISVRRNVLLNGVTGVGKTVIVQDFLREVLHTDDSQSSYNSVSVNFSAQTLSRNLQDLMEAKLEKKRKNLLGAPSGKQTVVFVDDINMPALEQYGAQPPIELLRQVIDLGGFYDRKKLFFKNVRDVLFLAACGPPGGGRNPISARLLRHFHLLSCPELSNSSMKKIFSSILNGFLAQFSDDISALGNPMVNAAVDVYNRACKSLLPTPSKSHYTFNLRDLSKVVQGVLQISPARVPDADTMLRLWCHESCRVFQDRLVDETDKTWFDQLIVELIDTHFQRKWTPDDFRPVLFGDWSKRDDRSYTEMRDHEQLPGILTEYMMDYNVSLNKDTQLVFFRDAIAHLNRVCRVLRQPRGNALLVGVGGSGRSSLVRLAAFICDYKLFQIEVARGYGITEFREDLKKVLMMAGCEDKATVFLFSDTQIVKESFLEDINGVLNTGEVPNLFAVDEMERIISAVRPKAKAAGKLETRDVIYAHFIQLVRENLHLVLTFSPVGDSFRNRLRMFPALVNNCSIDWYTEWPQDALYSVARRFIDSQPAMLSGLVPPGGHGTPEEQMDRLKDAVCKMCVKIHMSVGQMSKAFFNELRRYNYTTPTSYLELIQLYSTMLGEQRVAVSNSVSRLRGGLDKIISTDEMVRDMKAELTRMQPVLEQSVKDTAALLIELSADKKQADEVRSICVKEEKECQKVMAETQILRDDCQADLDKAMPAYYAAVDALKSLNKNDITEVKSFKTPPALVVTVMEAVCLLQGVKTTWDQALKLLSDSNFLSDLMTYDKDNIPEARLKKLQVYINNEDFRTEKVERVSKAAKSLCMWVHAINTYSSVAKQIEPKKARLAEAEGTLEKAKKTLAEKQGALAEIEARVAALQKKYEDSMRRKAQLEMEVKQTEVRLERAERLVNGLADERKRWELTVKQLETDRLNLVGNILMGSGLVAYGGPFTSSFRDRLIRDWVECGRSLDLNVDPAFTLQKIADPVQVRLWKMRGLPADDFSLDNGMLVSRGRRWPLMIDPQGQANQWVKNMERERGLKVVKLTDPTFLRTMENAIRVGQPVLLENVGEVLDPALEPVLLKQTYKSGGRLLIRLGENEVDYNPEFKLYMTTKLANPHYMPEICVKVTIINFTVTQSGLEDQLLAEVVRSERPDLEQQRDSLIVKISELQQQLKSIEDRILTLLANAASGPAILDDEVLINTLAASKKTSESVNKSVREAEETAGQIDAAREQYRPIATRGSILYFVIADMSGVDPMYQNSLKFFIDLFNLVLRKTPSVPDLQQRSGDLISAITDTTYVTICRGLFEKDKLLFSFMIAIQILRHGKIVTEAEWLFFLRGASSLLEIKAPALTQGQIDEAGKMVSADRWREVSGLSTLPGFNGLVESIADPELIPAWRDFMNSDEPHRLKLPGTFQSSLSAWQRLLVLKVLREEKLVPSMISIVSTYLGPKFAESPPFDLGGAFRDSLPTTPIIFVLSPGADPATIFLGFAASVGYSDRLKMLSLGQGQGPIASRMIEQARKTGEWVCLQNCHLSVSWMPSLERIMEELAIAYQTQQTAPAGSIGPESSDYIHPDFRLWLTSMPSNKFPTSVLQSGIKLTNEPPKGLKANMRRTFLDLPDTLWDGGVSDPVKAKTWKKLLFSLSFFHALIQERRKFAALGFNIAYDWNNSDLSAAMQSLRLYIEEQANVPFEAINYVTGVINYGGRVTDFLDLRCVLSILKRFFCVATVGDDSASFTADGVYHPPNEKTGFSMEDIRTYLSGLPQSDDPAIFGLHQNANISFQKNETQQVVDTIISIQPRASGNSGGKSTDQTVSEVAEDILARLPAQMDIERAHPLSIYGTPENPPPGSLAISLGTVLMQEVAHFNRLLVFMRKSLLELQKAIKGLVVMSSSLEKIYNNFLYSKVPEAWATAAYPSLKALAPWYADLLQRVEFLRSWLMEGPPNCFWLSGFYFPQGFLTGVLQTHARRFKIPIDTLRFRATVMDAEKPQDLQGQLAPTGVYVHGLFMEGARWDRSTKHLAESERGVLYTSIPVLWLEPIPNSEAPISSEGNLLYSCPIYKTQTRAGALSTTGLSTNFVLSVDLPSYQSSDFWVQRSVALLCALAEN